MLYMAYSGKIVDNKIIGQTLRFKKTSADTNGELLEMENIYSGRSVPHTIQRIFFSLMAPIAKMKGYKSVYPEYSL